MCSFYINLYKIDPSNWCSQSIICVYIKSDQFRGLVPVTASENHMAVLVLLFIWDIFSVSEVGCANTDRKQTIQVAAYPPSLLPPRMPETRSGATRNTTV